MKTAIIFAFISLSIHAEICVEDFADKINNNLLGECSEVTGDLDLLKLKLSTSETISKVCKDCSQSPEEVVRSGQEEFLNLGLDSIRKNLAQTTVDLLKLRSIYDSDVKFPINKCKLSDIGKGSCANKKLSAELQIIQKELGNELVNMLDPKKKAVPCLFERSDDTGCATDAQALYVQAKVAEKLFATNVKESDLKSLKLNPGQSIFSALTFKQKTNILENPHISFVLKDPEASKVFLERIKTKTGMSDILKEMYSSDLAALYTASINTECEKTVNSFEALCKDPRFIQGKLFPDKTRALLNDQLNGNRLEQKRIIRTWCSQYPNAEKSFNFSVFEKSILSKESRLTGLPHFQSEKSSAYQHYFAELKTNICTSTSCTDSAPDDIQCMEVFTWKNMQKPETEEHKQFGQSNEGINSLLGRMVGPSSGVDPALIDYLKNTAKIPIPDSQAVVENGADVNSASSTGRNVSSSKAHNDTSVNNSKQVTKSGDGKTQTMPTPGQTGPSTPGYYNTTANNFNNVTTDSDDGTEDDNNSPINQTVQQAMNKPFERELARRLMNSVKTRKKGEPDPVATHFNTQLKNQFGGDYPTFSEDVNKLTDKFYDKTYNDVQQRFGNAGNFVNNSGSNIRRQGNKPTLSNADREIIGGLVEKYKADVAAEAPKTKDNTELALVVDSKNKDIYQVLEAAKGDIIKKEEASYKLKIKIGDELFVFDVVDQVPTPAPGVKVPDHILKKVTEFFNKQIPPTKRRRLNYLKSILAAHGES